MAVWRARARKGERELRIAEPRTSDRGRDPQTAIRTRRDPLTALAKRARARQTALGFFSAA
jgi:hypothetical protein